MSWGATGTQQTRRSVQCIHTDMLPTCKAFPYKWLTSHLANWAESIAATLRFLVINQHRRLYGTQRCGYGLRRADGIEDGMVASQPAGTRALTTAAGRVHVDARLACLVSIGLHCQPIT
jgi:hypothetical protein